jgi:hypothetical protein
MRPHTSPAKTESPNSASASALSINRKQLGRDLRKGFTVTETDKNNIK